VSRELYLGLDVGTQGTKGLVVDAASGAVLARAGARYGLIEGLPPGAAEQDPRTWIEALGEVGRALWRQVGPQPGELAGVGVSGQQHGLVVLDAQGEVVRPAKLWCDTSTAEEAAQLTQQLGRAVPTGFTAPKVLWMQRREPDAWTRVAQVMLPHDYVNLRLTGRHVTEFGDASGSGWFDPVERRWDGRTLQLLGPGFEQRLPSLLGPGEPAGALTPQGAALLGLGADHAGACVAAGGGDNMMSAIGAGATRPGVAVLSLGTSATVFGFSERPVVDPAGAIAAFCDSTGGWLPLLCVMNATGVLEEVAAAFALDLEQLTRRAAEVAPGCEGVVLVPYLVGERVPDLPRATGSLEGLRPGLLRPGHVFRAALEGVALNLAWGLGRMRELGLAVDRLRLVGGGARNALWRSILADTLAATVEPCAEVESAALGGALQALWTARRARGEAASIDALAQSWVRLAGAAVEPDPGRARLYAGLAAGFRRSVAARHGGGAAG
jgi:D-xylulose kinase